MDIKFGNPVVDGINELSEAKINYFQARIKPLGITFIQAQTLQYINYHPGTMQKSLAEYLGKQTATITNVLKGLEKDNLINRKVPKENERQKLLYLTEDGQRLVAIIQTFFDDFGNIANQVFSVEEQRQLKSFGERLMQALSEVN
ncbi:MarR family winged helix-turn-helix transcriptional regulator [Priestia aryabhattai]|uniref:MarR family winged helix-turn-helix transcriptional regulator n=1 Tax=Priestia aryabhattai TaxID=412384 RepID=UPI0018741E0F|nr:MarR family winged helix-turn-helix transcriptional regulator [Priestia aryabhattai]MBE5102389.1 winged helix-turn-helix transcriptional regulator [Priestia aryabhattai]